MCLYYLMDHARAQTVSGPLVPTNIIVVQYNFETTKVPEIVLSYSPLKKPIKTYKKKI